MRLAPALVVSSVLLVVVAGVAFVVLSDGPGATPTPSPTDDEPAERDSDSLSDGVAPLVTPDQGSDAGTAKPSDPTVDAPPAPVELRPELPRTVSGEVVDEETGDPVAGAAVLYRVASTDGSRRTGRVTRTDDQGRFAELALVLDTGLADAEVEVWARSPVHAVTRVRPEEGPMRVVLRPLRVPRAPGAVVGQVVTSVGSPFVGRLLVELRDEFGVEEAQFAVADTAGRFELEGVPARAWNVRASGAEQGEWVEVPEDGVVPVRLVAGEGATAVGPASLPVATRPVVVQGVASDVSSRAVVVLRTRPRWRFRRRLGVDGARFPAVPVGTWALEVVEDDQVVARRTLRVEDGTDPLIVDLEVPE